MVSIAFANDESGKEDAVKVVENSEEVAAQQPAGKEASTQNGILPKAEIQDVVRKSQNPARRGLGSPKVTAEQRQRISRLGGLAPHKMRGLAAANLETRARVAKAGGNVRRSMTLAKDQQKEGKE